MADRSPAERFARVRALFDEVLEQPADQREALLAARATDEDDVVAEVRRWLVTAHASNDLLGATAGAFAGDLVVEPSPDVDSMARHVAAFRDRYELLEPIGDGAMARVYRARDLRHGRDVAIKVLDGARGELASASRFNDEIRALARVQHPNVLTLFDSGIVDEAPYFVTPFLAGGTLRDRLRHVGPFPLEEAARIVHDVATAIDAAHAAGLVHRDLKPENILMDGARPVVADFGIAQLLAHSEPRRTLPGFVLGTPAYMSPEQVDGDRPVDVRSDVFSLASIAYELFTGVSPHRGTTAQAVITRVLLEPPADPRTLRSTLPAGVATALLRGLAKAPADRFPSAGALAAAVRDGLDQHDGPRAARGTTTWARRAALLTTTVVLGGVAIWSTRGRHGAPSTDDAPLPARFELTGLIDQYLGSAVTITPNGRALVYTGSAAEGRPILVRALDQERPRRLPGTDGASRPVVSPSGVRIAFASTDHRLRVVDLDGTGLRDVASAWRFASLAWLGDDTVVVDNNQSHPGLVRVAVASGAAQRVTTVDSSRGETAHMSPVVDTGSRRVFFTIAASSLGPRTGVGEIGVAHLDAPRPLVHARVGVRGRVVVGVLDGWLLYIGDQGGTINAVRLDPATAHAVGTPIAVLADGRSVHAATLAANGTLVYTRSAFVSRPVLVDSTGKARPIDGVPSGSYMNPRISPSGDRLLVQVTAANSTEPRVIDLRTGRSRPVPGAPRGVLATWLGGSNRIAYLTATATGLAAMVVDPWSDSTAREIASVPGIFGLGATADGRSIVFHGVADGRQQLWRAPVDGSAPPERLVDELDPAMMPAVAPNGRWVAYVALRGVREEVIVRPLPGPGAAVQVSDGGGTEPAWADDGRRLYFRRGDALMATDLRPGPTMQVVARRLLFRAPFDGEMPHRNYDVTPDGQRFVFIAAESAAHADALFLQGWRDQVRKRLRASTATVR
jgi:eukaryotic-like serine/threonine-protein kinase